MKATYLRNHIISAADFPRVRKAQVGEGLLDCRRAMSASIEFGRKDREACVYDVAELVCCSAYGTGLARDDERSGQLPAFEGGGAIGC
jgi:hypothetical protein